MTDIRELCKIFLDFVYDNKILPDGIVEILKKTNNGDYEWDFRLICKLLQFKENYHLTNQNSTLEEVLEMNARYLQYVDVWRDATSVRHLDNLWRAANDFFHNVAVNNPVFKVALEDLIQRAHKTTGDEYIKRIENNEEIVSTYTGTYDDFKTYINDYVKNKIPNLTRKHRGGGCRWCTRQDATLQSAHLRGRERDVLMREVWAELAQQTDNKNIFRIDIEKFVEQINKIHSDPQNFYFLCSECHNEYDKENSTMPDRFEYGAGVKSTSSVITTIPAKELKKGSNSGSTWSRTSAKAYCINNGYQVSNYYTFASENNGKKGIFWANPTPKCLQNDWDLILNDANNHCLRVFRIPANTYKIDDFYLKRNKDGKVFLQLEIDKGSFIETKRNLDFKPYQRKVIEYKKTCTQTLYHDINQVESI